jgi:hypothetical protein
MKVLALGRSALCVSIAVAMLAGCGGSQPPIAAMPQSAAQSLPFAQRDAIAARDDSFSWMARDAVTQDLLYVSDVDEVVVYSYPRGQLQGKLRGFFTATGMCTDGAGDVYVADGNIYEYKHGGTKRIGVLYPEAAVGCSIDPITGNLAVTDLQGSSGNGNVAIFKNASGSPTYYSAPGFWEYYFCGYDEKGNLFIDGLSSPGTGHFTFAELPRGSTTFKDITLNQYIGFPGGVQWDGKHVAVGDQIATIYRFAISGSQGTLVGTTQLSGAKEVKQAWIQGARLIAPNSVSGPGANVLIYDYPTGGGAIKTIERGVEGPQGATVSLAPG